MLTRGSRTNQGYLGAVGEHMRAVHRNILDVVDQAPPTVRVCIEGALLGGLLPVRSLGVLVLVRCVRRPRAILIHGPLHGFFPRGPTTDVAGSSRPSLALRDRGGGACDRRSL
jgi:hypothetical protein